MDKSIVGTNIEYCCEKNLGKSLNFIGEVGFKVLLEQIWMLLWQKCGYEYCWNICWILL